MSKLNQVIAISQSKKSQAKSDMEKAYHVLQKPELFQGLERQYKPKEDDGETLPAESKKVQLRAKKVIQSIRSSWENMFDVVLTNDTGNAEAKSDVVVNGQTILENVPVTTLIFLEKQLQDLNTLVNKIPITSSSVSWNYDDNASVFRSETVSTHRTKKIEEPVVLYDATDKHPAQTALVKKDVVVGYWDTTQLSSEMSQAEVETLRDRVRDLKEAVVKARESANSLEVNDRKEGEKVLDYIFSGIIK